MVAGAVGRQLGVADQGEVLGRVRHAVDLAVEGDRLDRVSAQAALLRGGELDRVDRAVLHQVADPVVRADHHVGAAALLGGGDEGGLLVLGDGLDLDGDAVLAAELLGERLEGGGPLVVGPDHQLAARALAGWRRRRSRGRRAAAAARRRRAPRTRAATTPAVRMRMNLLSIGSRRAPEMRADVGGNRMQGPDRPRSAVAGTLARAFRQWKTLQILPQEVPAFGLGPG